MADRVSRRVVVGQLIGIFLLALGVRLWGIDFGLPYGQIPDETTDITMSFQLARGQLPPYPFHRVAWSLVQIPIHGTHFAALKLASPNYGFADFEAYYYTNRSVFILLTRISMAVIGSLCIVPMYFIGRDLSRHLGGAMAALIVALHPLHVYLSHTALPDILATLATAICLIAALRIAEDGRKLWYFIGGITTALALLVRVQIAPIGTALVVAHIIYSMRQPSNRISILTTRWLWLVLGGVIGLAVFNPIIWLNPAAALADLQFIFSERFVGTYQNDPHAQTSLANSFYNVAQNISLPLTLLRPAVLATLCIGIVFGFIRRDVRILIVVALAVFALPILGAPGPRITYWLALVIPGAALASYGIASLAAYRRGRYLSVAAAVIVLGWCAIETIKIDTVLSQSTTQELAYDYITTQWPAGTSILEGDPFVYSVPLSRTTGSMERMATVDTLPSSYDFFLKNPDLMRHPAYDVYGSEYRSTIKSDEEMTQFLSDHEIEYVVEVDWCYEGIGYGNLSDLTFPLITPTIRDQLTLVEVFSPFDVDTCVQPIENRTHMEYMRLDSWVRPGPIVRLYRVD